MSLLAGSVSNVPPPTTSPRPVGAVPVLESRKRCHTDEPINQVARQLDFEMVIEEGPLLHEGAVGGEFEEQGPAADEGTVGGEDQGPDDGTVSGEDEGTDDGTVSGEDQGADPDTVTEDGTGDDEHAVGEEGEHQAPDEEEDGNPEKPHPDESDKSVADALANTAHRLCPMLRPLTGKRAQTVRSLITWIAFVLWRWHIENNVSQSALVPLLQLIVQVISVAGAHEINANLVAEVFPNTIFKLRKWFGMDDAGNFQKMVCCNKCYRIYPDDGSMRYRSNDRHRKLLTRPCYGAVVKQGRDTLCNEVLFDCKKTEKGTLVYTPKHIYCYQPLSKSLDNLLSRLGFLDKCNAWRRRRATRGVYSDIYDGSVWKRFVTNGFLREETSLALQLNLDWFQPFTRRNNISVGAIYLSILNLPREDRYKLENVILLGIIPNLTHEPNTLEYLLRPLVEELKIFYKDGIHLPKTDRLIKCVLICVTCDLPATRKVCGFLGHSAKLGCSRCLLDFGAGTTKM